MLFNSYVFLFLFLPCALAGYYLSARLLGPTACKLWLCGASLVFYAWWSLPFALLLLASIAFNFGMSRLLLAEAGSGRRQDALLFAVVGANLLLLFYYKYLFPLLDLFHQLGVSSSAYGSVVLPLGISFFT